MPQMSGLIQGGMVADTDQDVLQPVAIPCRVVNVVGGHISYAQVPGQFHQVGHQALVVGEQVILELDPEVIPAEDPSILLARGQGLLGASGQEVGGDLSLPAAGETNEALSVVSQGCDGERGPGFARPGVVSQADQAAQVGPAP